MTYLLYLFLLYQLEWVIKEVRKFGSIFIKNNNYSMKFLTKYINNLYTYIDKEHSKLILVKYICLYTTY